MILLYVILILMVLIILKITALVFLTLFRAMMIMTELETFAILAH